MQLCLSEKRIRQAFRVTWGRRVCHDRAFKCAGHGARLGTALALNQWTLSG